MSDARKWFYYLPKEKPVLTVCFMKSSNGDMARGIAVKSHKDQHYKAKARNIAEGRALKAITTGVSDKQIDKISGFKKYTKTTDDDFYTKFIYTQHKLDITPELTALEEKLCNARP